MKVSHLALAVAMLAVLAVSAHAQEAGMYPPGYGGAPGYAYPAPGGYGMQGAPMMQQQGAYSAASDGDMQNEAMQEQLYGPGQGGPMQAGDGGECPCGPGAAQAECYHDQLTHWAYFDLEAFYARRTMGVVSSPVSEFTTGAVLETTTSAPALKYEPGVKATVGYMFPWAFALEASFEGQNYWTSRAGETAPLGGPFLTVPPPLGPALIDLGSAAGGTSQITTAYTSRFDSTEFNFVRPYANIQWLVGVRYIELNDRYDIQGTTAAPESSDYLITSHNHLLGPQIGVRGQWQISRLQFDLEGKGGVFANSAAEYQTIGDVGNTITIRDTGATNTELSFAGEVSAYVTMPVFSFLTAKLGYTGLWVSDLALAPNQLDFSNTATSGTTLNAHEGIIIHGFNAGFEARW
jgi:hypothetical protein